MSNGSTTRPGSPETTLRESACAAAADLAELAAILPGDAAANARVADKLSEEVAELGQMLRALPRCLAAMSGHDVQLLSALRTAHAAGEDIGETIARALARLAADLGGSFEVIKARPGSWEAALIAELLRRTVGPDEESLPMYGPGTGGSL
jgi:hypothetical protein